MGVLDRFEKGIERAVNGAFAKAFRSEVQPVEIASALRRECDEKASIVGRDRTIAPNTFVVELGRADHDRLGEWETALGDELSAAVHEHARQQRYAFVGPVQVQFAEAEDLDTGVFRVRSQTARPDQQQQYAAPHAPQQPPQPAAQELPYAPHEQHYAPQAQQPDPYAPAPQGSPLPAAPPYPGAPPAGYPGAAAPAPAYPAPSYPAPSYPAPAAPSGWDQQPAQQPAAPAAQQPAGYAPSWATPPTSLGTLDVDGRPHRIDRAVTVIGRAMDVDIVLDDPGVSRRHSEVHVVDGKARVIDLGSTNGTFVDGERVHAGTLADGSVITVGRTRITYHSGQW
ncbi:MAG: DUF3662 domain-containing protein [Actinobacteria bacterium]|nr:DUF3662 domain-containing protein [Actinomycetota bacterium]